MSTPPRRRWLIRLLPFLLFLLLALGFGWQLSGNMSSTDAPNTIRLDPLMGKPLPDFSVPMLKGGEVSEERLTQERLKGKPHLLNIMASWCAPCRVEHYLLRDYAEARRIPIYAIAWKDAPEDLAKYLQQMGNIYAEVGLDPHGEAAIAFGITGVPETYLVDAEGRIAVIYRGALTKEILQQRFDPVLQRLREAAE